MAPKRADGENQTAPSASKPDAPEIALQVARLSAVFDTLAEGLVIATPDGRILNMNPAARRLLEGDPLGEVPSTLEGFASLVEVADSQGKVLPWRDWPMARAMRGETFADCQVRLRRKSAEGVRYALCGGHAVCDGTGNLALVLLTLRDI